MAKPKKTFKCGGVRAKIWENEQTGDKGPFVVKSVSFDRSYKKSDGKWDSSPYFRKNDLPKLEVVCRKAFEFLNKRQKEQEPEVDSSREED